MKKKVLNNLLLVCMTIVMLFSCTIGASAISMEGSSTVGGKPSATTNGAYAISSKDDLAGWRFAVVTTSGTISGVQGSNTAICVDIIVNDKESYIASNHYMLDPQYPKIKFVQMYGDTSTQHAPAQTVPLMVSASTKTLANNNRVLKESSMGFSAELPDYGDYSNLSSAMNTWQQNSPDLGKVLNKFKGFTNGVADLTDAHRVTVEPIYRVSIAGETGKGEWHLMTPTEMAWFSGACYGYNCNGWSGGTLDSDIYASNGDGTWGFIGNYTHRYWPASLFTENTRSLPWQPVSETEAKNTVDNNRSPRIRLRCYDIIRKGYGVAILYTSTGGSSDDPPSGSGSNIDLSIVQIQYIEPEASSSGFIRRYYVYLDKSDYPGYKIVIMNPTTGTTAVSSGGSGYPTFSYGAPITVYAQFKNNGKTTISLDGYFTKAGGTQTAIPASPTASSTYPAADDYSLDPGETKWFWVDQFDAMQLGESSYTAEVYQNGKKSADGESNTTNNKLTAKYFVSGDLSVDVIRYNYQDPATGKWVYQQVHWGDGTDPYLTLKKVGTDGTWTEVEDLPRFPAGVTVTVWVKYRNNQNRAAKIDGFYSLDNGNNTIVGAHPTNSSVYPSSDGFILGGYNEQWFWVTSFDTTSPGTHSITTSVYYDGRTSAAGETSVDNNSMVSEYFVRGYDVGILDIYYKDEEGTIYGQHSSSVTLDYGKTYDVYYTVKNFGTESARVHIYNNVDPTADGALRVTQYENGAFLAPGQMMDLYAGKFKPEDQAIGENAIGGSVFIGDNTSTSFTYGSFTGVEADTTNNTREETITLKYNVAIKEVYLTPVGSDQRFPDSVDYDGYVDITVGSQADVHYVLKNDTNMTIDVNIYMGSTPVMQTVNNGSLVITLGPYEEKDVILDRKVNVTAEVRRKIVASVYRDGYDPNADPYEKTFDDNVAECYYNGVILPYLAPITPNAPYREGTNVITSYYLFNPTSKAYTGLAGATAEVQLTVKVKRTGEVIYEASKFTVVPAGTASSPAQQLVYFKWKVPEDVLKDTDKFEICADLVVSQYPDIGISYVSYSQSYISKDAMYTPDTDYEEKEPDGWTKPTTAKIYDAVSKKWSIWYYENNRFVRRSYGLKATTGELVIKPDDAVKTDYERYPGEWVMKSGYGIQVESFAKSTLYQLPGYSRPTSDMYTSSQYSYMVFPEFQYKVDYKLPTISTLEKVGSTWKLMQFMDYGRVHFTPIWYPDGDYTVYACHSDIWTPMGMITVGSSDSVEIEGNAYDDWYIGHG